MKQILKRSLSVFLAITIIFSSAYVGLSEVNFSELFAVKASAASSGKCGDNLTWTFNNKGILTISGTGDMYSYANEPNTPWGDLSVKSVIIEDGVTSIGDCAFGFCDLTSIEIPDSVTSIGIAAFALSGLTTITIPDSVTKIDHMAFYYSDLISVTIPDSVTSIGEMAFCNSYDLTNVVIGDGVKSIGADAFYHCESLTSITIGDSVTSVGNSAFVLCKSLNAVYITDLANWCEISFESSDANPLYYAGKLYVDGALLTDLYVPDGVTNINDYTFYNCTELTSITIPDSVKSIGNVAFYNCTNLNGIYISNIGNWCEFTFNGYDDNPLCYTKNLYLNGELLTDLYVPYGVKSISDYAFYNCTSLASVEIPDSVTSIGDRAFTYCESLVSIVIPDSVTSIGGSAFYDTRYYNNSSNWKDNVLYIGNHLIKSKTSLSGKYVIKEVTKTIADEAFCFCNLESIEIPDSVTSIGDSAFESCESLESIVIPDSVTSIGEEAFLYCDNLESIVIPDSITSIGERTFYNCINLTSVTVGNSVTNIGDRAFGYCDSLESIVIPDSVTSIGEEAFYNCESLVTVSLGAGVAEIGADAFSYCFEMKAINVDSNNKSYSSDNGVLFNVDKTALYCFPEGYGGAYSIPDGVTNIGDEAFSRCKNLLSVEIPDSVTSIGSWAFYNCENLTSVTIGDSVTSIGSYAFYYCESLTSITIGDSVTNIGDGAFDDCTSLNAVYITDLANWCEISFESSDANPLYYAPKLYVDGALLTDLYVPDGVTSIGSFAFYNCTSLASIEIPDSVTNIGERTFYNCTSLASVTLGEGVTSIGSYAFFACEKLKRIEIPKSVTSIGDRAFGWLDGEYADGGYKRVNRFTVIGAKDSAAENYAKSEGFKFIVAYLSKPKLSKISNTASGVKITWDKVEGADSYIVYRKTKGGSWSKIGSTSKVSYTDKKAKSGTTYYYAVKAKNEAGNTDYSNSLSIKRLSVPKLSSVANTSSGVKVTWKKVNGASGYIVYRKTKSGDWKEIGKTTKLYYTDKKAKSGTSYYYSVRAYSGSVKSYYDTDGLSIRRLVTPKISSATSKSEGILIKWNKITGASGYYVYRKASSGEWKKIATVKGNTKIKYLDETPRKGATYQYRVKAYYSKSTSGNSNSYKIKCKY